jgi:hypothetical protein
MSAKRGGKRPGAGRKPDGITEEQSAILCEAIKQGAFIETAVILAGIEKSTFYGWLRCAQRDEADGKAFGSIYVTFSRRVKKALAEAERDYVAIIQARASTVWQAAAWMLERRFPKRWARKESKDDGGDKAG